MKTNADRIKKLSEALAALLEQEKAACGEIVSSVMESVRLLHEELADRRLQPLVRQLRKIQQRLELLVEIAGRDFLNKIAHDAEALQNNDSNGALPLFMTLLEAEPLSLTPFFEALLARVNSATGAERSFFLAYLPESTEAEIIARRNFPSANLSLEDYSFSRTVLAEVLQRGVPLLLTDASCDQQYSVVASVKKFGIKSVLAVPVKSGSRTVGAFYLANDTIPCAFAQEDLRLLTDVARFVTLYLRHTRLFPLVFPGENRIYFDTSKATGEIVGTDAKILNLLDLINRIADSPATVLIEGESGTGKELVARALHYQSNRRQRPFVAINCAAIPENLLESELFGYERGAFTGAIDRYIGRIEQSDGGTIFLDEISEMSYALQAKLLRFLQNNEFQRLGGKETRRASARVVAATSKDLKAMMAAGKFQEALYYRLNVIPLFVPPLRARKDDIPLLINHFLARFSAIYGKAMRMEQEAYEWLKEYDFPGNIRELENLIHRLVALALNDTIGLGNLPREILQIDAERLSLKKDVFYTAFHSPPADFKDLRRRRNEINRRFNEQARQLIEQALKETDGSITAAARRLGIHRITLHKMIRKRS